MKASGTASLPLHYGRVPSWLATRMSALGAAIAQVVILEEGSAGFLRRLSDPLWFQALGATLGMDWHSSGITTSVLGALKRGLAPQAKELGLYICGGRGRHSRRTPDELRTLSDRTGLDGDALIRASRLVARVDSNAVQDGFDIYLHSFIVDSNGSWVVVQQGMNTQTRLARRYHWRSENVRSFVEEPHDAVFGQRGGNIVNFTDHRAQSARSLSVELSRQSPDKVVTELRSIVRHAQLPHHHEVRASDVFLRRLHGVLAAANDRDIKGFEELLLTPGLGRRSLQALGLVAEVAYGAPSRFEDPARFAFAHGGKDGHPHPVPLHVYDRSIDTLRTAVKRAKLGQRDKLDALQRLEQSARAYEKCASSPSFDAIVEQEWQQSSTYGGMTVLGPSSDAVRRAVFSPEPRLTKQNAQSRQTDLVPISQKPQQLSLAL